MNRSIIPWRRKSGWVEKPSDEHPLDMLHRQMNELFDDFFGDVSRSGLLPEFHERGLSAVTPRFEVAETDEAIQVTAELPGMEEKDIQVTLDENMLTVKGEKKQEREEKKKNYFFSERSYGLFERSLPVPSGIDKEKVKATFKKGVLHLTLPKTEKAKSEVKKIAISAE